VFARTRRADGPAQEVTLTAPFSFEALQSIYQLGTALSRAAASEAIFAEALIALERMLGADRAAILLFDPDGVMRFKAWRGLSDAYRRVTEGHSPWAPDTVTAHPILVGDAETETSLAGLRDVIRTEGIRALGFLPLVQGQRLLGKCMIYYDHVHDFTDEEVRLAETVASHIALAVDRQRIADRLHFQANLLDAVGEAVIATDLDGTIVYWNRAAQALYGWSADEVRGRKVVDVVCDPASRAEAAAILARVEAGESWSGEFPVCRRDGRSFRAMVTDTPIRNADGKLIGVIGVSRDISEQKQAEAERSQLLIREQMARADAEAANRAKDEFLATLSHELRTPVTAIVGWAQVLRVRAGDPAIAGRAIETIERNAHVQAQLVEDLLDVSRIVSGQLRLDAHPLDLIPVIEAALDTVRPAAEVKGIRVESQLDPSAGPVSGDPDRLQQVISNLLANAVKFTPQDGRVQVRLERDGPDVEIAVSDTGQGIPPAFLPQIFDRFRQAESGTARAHGGLGLGLAIVRHLVELHGGTVAAESAGEGHGATFRVRLPIARLASGAPAGGGPPFIGLDPASLPSLDGLHLLLVEDDADSREALAVVLGQYGAKVTAVGSAAEALATISQSRPDVLVSDIGMPGEDGYSLLRTLRALPPEQGGAIPAIALTGYARPADRARVLAVGFQSHVAKPVEPADLVSVIARLAGRTGGSQAAG
jgi:PAS domain S-box-containing protein